MINHSMEKSATFSICRNFRFSLERHWKREKGFALFVCLNPSTADETVDDPTIRRCIRFSESWGYGGLVMCNLFAYRSTNPKALYNVENRPNHVMQVNYINIKNYSHMAGITIAAWGTHGGIDNMSDYYIREVLEKPHHLGLTKGGFPRHPLYLRADTKPQPLHGVA